MKAQNQSNRFQELLKQALRSFILACLILMGSGLMKP